MTLVDTSAWIEFIRGGRRDVRAALRSLIDAEEASLTEPVVMEVLAGARDEAHARKLSSMFSGVHRIRIEGLADWESAAAIYRICKSAGDTVGSQLDCLIAAVAIREGVPVLHADQHFDLIARHTPLRVVAL